MSRPASLLKLEQDAYYAVLRALAVNELDWTKEKLLTDLRKVLNISNDQHFQFLEEVMEDKLVLRLQESKNNPAAAPPPPAPVPAPAYDMPPPPRQTASTANLQRKAGRPNSAANLKNQGSVTPPLGPRISRQAEQTFSGDGGRRRQKRERDEGFDPRRPSSGALKSKASAGARNRGRGRRISGLTREMIPLQTAQVVQQKYKLLPFEAGFLQDKLTSGTVTELEDMHAALLLRDQAIQAHLDLIHQLEDDTLVTKSPVKFCQMLIQELEMTEARLNVELEALKDEDEREV